MHIEEANVERNFEGESKIKAGMQVVQDIERSFQVESQIERSFQVESQKLRQGKWYTRGMVLQKVGLKLEFQLLE